MLLLGVASLSAAADQDKADKEGGIKWKPLLLQSGWFLGIEHGFRLSTEQDTRDGIQGHFFSNYLNAVGNLHGWADGDPFLVNYIGHPMQGAVIGYIFNQNDPRHAGDEYSNTAAYWKGRLKATAWSWAYSEQFEMGPLSEASIGHIQNRFPQYGFVDHVITPVVGLGWMVVEDALDKYLIKRIEAHTENNWVRLLVRGGLNPTRSFANVMAFQPPWHRNSRPGIRDYHPAQISRNKPEQKESPIFGSTPKFEFALRYTYSGNPGSAGCNGAGGEGTWAFTPWLSGVVDISGCKSVYSNPNLSGDSLLYMAGLRFSRQLSERWEIYGQALAGGNKITEEEFFPEIKKLEPPPTDKDQWIQHAMYTKSWESNVLVTSFGGGAQYKLNNALAFRVGSLDYIHNWTGGSPELNQGDGFRVSTGLVLRFGTW